MCSIPTLHGPNLQHCKKKRLKEKEDFGQSFENHITCYKSQGLLNPKYKLGHAI